MKERRTIWVLRVLAIGMAVLTWMLISLEQRELTREQALQSQVQYSNRPANLIILDPVETVQVRVSGPESRMAALNQSQVNLVVDLTNAVQGLQEIQLHPQDVIRPQGIDVVAIEPSSLSIELDAQLTEVRKVLADFSGEPAAGAQVQDVLVDPGEVLVRGPESILRDVDIVYTRKINLDRHAITFQESTLVEPPDSLVTIIDQIVTVTVVMEIPSVGGPNGGVDDQTAL